MRGSFQSPELLIGHNNFISGVLLFCVAESWGRHAYVDPELSFKPPPRLAHSCYFEPGLGYSLVKTLGKGCFGTVHLVKPRDGGEERVVKEVGHCSQEEQTMLLAASDVP